MKAINRWPPRPSRMPAWLALLIAITLAGCTSLVPPLKAPEIETPSAFKNAADLPATERGQWKVAEPADKLPRGQWWRVFGDPQLDALVDEALRNNQNLAAIVARVKQARSLIDVNRADGQPQVNTGFGPSRSRLSPASQGLPADATIRPATLWRAPVTLSYEVDLFGRIGANTAAAGFDAEAAQAQLESLRLSLAADVATAWYQLREIDAEREVLARSIELRRDWVGMLERRLSRGDIAELDVARSRAELATAQSDLEGLAAARARQENALAVLTGKPPTAVVIAALPGEAFLNSALPAVPAGLPSALLERRPDIAAAQRTMAAANQRIGVAKTAFFPSLKLTGSAGFESNELGDLFKWGSRTWLLGPIIGTALTVPLFDGGRNRANLARSEAALEESVATYRQQVLVAFGDVEDSLAGLRSLSAQTRAQADALAALQLASRLAQKRYDAGASSYFEVIDAQRTLLTTQRASVQLQGAKAVGMVALIRALGGGWN